MFSFFSRLFGRSGAGDPLVPGAGRRGVGSLSALEFVDQHDPAAPVLDVRTRDEFSSGHLRGAIHVDVLEPDFRDRVEALVIRGTLQKDAPVYLYCRSGNRSQQAVGVLRQMGFGEPINVGGFGALKAAGARVE